MKKMFFLFGLLASMVCAAENKSAETLVQEEVYHEVQKDIEHNFAPQQNDFAPREILESNKEIRVSVIGQGVAPAQTISPSQAYALAKRAAIADGYRLIAEKVKGVYVEGQDVIRNMMVKRTDVRTHVSALVKEANIVETTFKEGLCEVEMEIVLYHSLFAD